MGSKTAYLSKALLDHVLGGPDYARPDTLWVVLSSESYNPYATGDACNELTPSDYARLPIANDLSLWTAASIGYPSRKQTQVILEFPAATTQWPAPYSVYLADAATSGNLLYGTDVIVTAQTPPGASFRIPLGSLVVQDGFT